MKRTLGTTLVESILFFGLAAAAQQQPLKVFISVDMEGIGGIGTSEMTRPGGKDYALGRRLMTEEVQAVIEGLRAYGSVRILVNDSHGDMRNLLHTELPEDVEYNQGNIKALGMVEGLEAGFDAVIFLGYHSRAGTEGGFLAHTGSGSVKGLWLNDIEVGEGGLNAAFAGELGVPVILAAGDLAFTRQIRERIQPVVVPTKEAIGAQSARLIHPQRVRQRLQEGVRQALSRLDSFPPWNIGKPVRIRMRFASTTHADILQAIPGMTRIDGYTVAYRAEDMQQAYRLIRLMYKYVSE